MERMGSEYPFTGPELACGISVGIAKKVVRDWTETIKNIGSPQEDKHVKDVLQRPSGERLRELLEYI
jgi:hypothetical protein